MRRALLRDGGGRRVPQQAQEPVLHHPDAHVRPRLPEVQGHQRQHAQAGDHHRGRRVHRNARYNHGGVRAR